MAQNLPNVNPFGYTNRTFQTIYSELKTLYPNKPDWFMRIMAGETDILHWYLDARAQNLLLRTAFTEEAVRDLCAYLDYYPDNSAAASGDITVEVSSFPLLIPKAELTFSVTSALGETKVYEATGDANFTASTLSIPVVEGRTKSLIDIGTSDGTTEWQEFILPDTNVLIDSIELSINSLAWDKKDNLVGSSGTDRHFRVIVKPNRAIAILFGNGTFGAIPPPSVPILATYRVGGGISGNIKQAGATVAYTGGNINVTDATLDGDFTGGADRELLSNAKRLAPQMLRTNYRAVTENDIETLSVQFSSSIIVAKALPNLYGAGTVGVHIVPSLGGVPSSGLKTSLQAYLKERASLANTDIRVRDPLYQPEDVSASIKMKSGFLFSVYQPYAELVCYLQVSEVTQEIIDIFSERGIEEVVSYVNTKWGFTFGSTDYNELSRVIRRREREGAVVWGGDLVANDIISALDDLTGVEFPLITTPAPSSFVSVAFNRIMTEGLITVAEIP